MVSGCCRIIIHLCVYLCGVRVVVVVVVARGCASRASGLGWVCLAGRPWGLGPPPLPGLACVVVMFVGLCALCVANSFARCRSQ